MLMNSPIERVELLNSNMISVASEMRKERPRSGTGSGYGKVNIMPNLLSIQAIQTDDEDVFHGGKIMTKFCTLGMVTSKKWTATFLTVGDGKIELFASKNSWEVNPNDPILRIQITKYHQVSDMMLKNYSQNPLKVIDFFCFYIEIENGIFPASRLLKIGCLDQLQALALVKAIKMNIKEVKSEKRQQNS